MKTLHPATITRGTIKFADIAKLQIELRGFEGKEVTVTIERKRRMRSNNQNKFYWGVVIPIIAELTGYDKDRAHDAMRLKFLRESEAGNIDTVRSTTSRETQRRRSSSV